MVPWGWVRECVPPQHWRLSMTHLGIQTLVQPVGAYAGYGPAKYPEQESTCMKVMRFKAQWELFFETYCEKMITFPGVYP